jgi:ketol-acid reductoisomerase
VGLGFAPTPVGELHGQLLAGDVVALLCPDTEIRLLYQEIISRAEVPLTMVLAHGYAVYARELPTLLPGHSIALLAPKAIGPKLREAHVAGGGKHALRAAVEWPSAPEARARVLDLAKGLGFLPERLVETTATVEAIGDLISEQSLLCGGVFPLLEWTAQLMREAGVPEALIREECLTELELVAGLIRERGPSAAFSAISSAAQAGTVAMRRRLIQAGVPEAMRAQAEDVMSRAFADEFRGDGWRTEAEALGRRLEAL